VILDTFVGEYLINLVMGVAGLGVLAVFLVMVACVGWELIKFSINYFFNDG